MARAKSATWVVTPERFVPLPDTRKKLRHGM
jgi:hypothetical protein